MNGFELVHEYENVDNSWKYEVGVEVVTLCGKKDYMCYYVFYGDYWCC